MHVTHIEWENEFNVIIFQCGWYRGIIVYLALKERSCSFRAFLVSFIYNDYSVPHRVIPKIRKEKERTDVWNS